jgi:DNA-binding CsgD family transcriptional regulator
MALTEVGPWPSRPWPPLPLPLSRSWKIASHGPPGCGQLHKHTPPDVAESVLGFNGWLHRSALTGGRRWRWWVRSWGLSVQEQEELWARWRQGESLRLIARRLGKRGPSVRAFVLQTGGVQRQSPHRNTRCLTMAEREEISRGVAAGEPCRQIAARLGRPRQRCRGSWRATAAAPDIEPSALMRRPTGERPDPSRPSWRWPHGCAQSWSPNWGCAGHPTWCSASGPQRC